MIWMLKHRHTDKICVGAAVAALFAVISFALWSDDIGVTRAAAEPGYASRLFDDSRVHSIDLKVEDWEGFISGAPEEEYVQCDVAIDGEMYGNVGLRAKGNNSLGLVTEYGLDRYSLKLEFDHYGSGTYHGLDKMSLDASFQDNSYMKNYLAYDMMEMMGVPAPMTSYVWVTVNGEAWGLFLAVEEPEDAFLRRVYGRDQGKLYKPDYRYLEEENADVALRYTDDSFESYDNIFRNARTEISDDDRKCLIDALKILSEASGGTEEDGEELSEAVNVYGALRYFAVQSFVVNLDSYLGPTGHNYFLHERDGILTILPWDYNLAFATYSLGMPEPINDAELYVNYPIDTPASGQIMMERPLFHNIMKVDEYHRQYHRYYDMFLEEYFENGYFQAKVTEVYRMIAPYVEEDPTAYCSYEDFQEGVETITDFCLLRAESVRKQLQGEIPATIRGQSLDSSGFVDASDIWLPDMGEIADLYTE